jgi:hypothetical protein
MNPTPTPSLHGESRFARRVRTATRVGLGAVLVGAEKAGEILDTVANRAELPALPAGDPTLPGTEGATTETGPATATTDRRALLLGAVFAAEDQVVGAAEALGRAGGQAGRVADRAWRLVTPEFVRDRVDERVADLNARGRHEDQISREEAADAMGTVVEEVTGGDWLVEVINEVIGEVINPIIDTVLPIVINRLNEDPEPIQVLVRDQSLGMAGEITDGVRASAINADSTIERVARRLTFRGGRRELDGPPALAVEPLHPNESAHDG